MKKGFFAILAVLMVAAMAFMGCPAPDDPVTPDNGDTKYTVTFNADGGTPAPGSQSVVSGGKVTEPPAMTKANSTFAGWYKEAAFTTQWNFATDTVTMAITLYAKWTAAAGTFTVTFNANGGTPAPGSQNVPSGGKVTQPAAMTKANSTFAGWYKEAAFTTQWNFATDTVTAAITLHAKWDAGSTPPPALDLARAEKVSVANNWHPIYSFTLAPGKTWADYEGLKASYMFLEEDLETARARNARIIGPYEPEDFNYFAGTESAVGKNFYLINANSQAAGHYIDDGALTNSETAGSLLTQLEGKGITAVGGEWFEYALYDITGTRKNGNLTNYPAEDATGTFLLAIGLPGAGSSNPPNIYYARDITLTCFDGPEFDVVGVPLWYEKDGVAVPAFFGYDTTGGSNGYGDASREMADGSDPVTVPAPGVQEVTITFKLNTTDTTAVFTGGFTGTRTILKNAQVGALPGASRTDYILLGWAETDTGTTPIEATMTFSEDADLYAIWLFDAPEGTPKPLTFNVSTDFTNTGSVIVEAITNGYKVTYNGNGYGNSNAYFKLNFTTLGIEDLSEIKAITFDYTPIGGDVSNKGVYLIASSTAHGWAQDSVYGKQMISTTYSSGVITADDLNVGQSVKLYLDQTKIGIGVEGIASNNPDGNPQPITTDWYFAIRIHADAKSGLPAADTATSFSIANVNLIPYAED